MRDAEAIGQPAGVRLKAVLGKEIDRRFQDLALAFLRRQAAAEGGGIRHQGMWQEDPDVQLRGYGSGLPQARRALGADG